LQSWRGRPPTDRDRVSIGNSERLPPVKVESRTNIRRNPWRFFIRRHANAALYGLASTGHLPRLRDNSHTGSSRVEYTGTRGSGHGRAQCGGSGVRPTPRFLMGTFTKVGPPRRETPDTTFQGRLGSATANPQHRLTKECRSSRQVRGRFAVMTGAVDWTAALNQAVARFKGKVTTSLTRA
jgi:hypothetical protein